MDYKSVKYKILDAVLHLVVNLSINLKNIFFALYLGLSVEMLATVGETIGEENPDIRGDMQVIYYRHMSVVTVLEFHRVSDEI